MTRIQSTIRAVCCVALLCHGGIAVADSSTGQTMDEQAFARYYVQQVAEQRPELTVKAQRGLELEIADPEGEVVKVWLSNAYRNYRGNPGGLNDIINNHVASIASAPPKLDVGTTSAIRPVIKSDEYIAELRKVTASLENGPDEFPFLVTELNDDLNVLYVMDTEHSMSMVEKKSIEEMKLSEAGVRTIAIENLTQFYTDIGIGMESLETEGGGIVAYLVGDGNYEASAILVDVIVTELDKSVQGDLVVFIPARDVFLVTGTDEPGGYAAAAGISSNLYNEAAYVISPHGYVWRNGRWDRYSE